MTLGALIVLAVLVVAGIYVPRSSRTHAKSPDANAPTQLPGGYGNAQSGGIQSGAVEPRHRGFTGGRSQSSCRFSAGARSSTAPPAPPATPNASADNSNSMQHQAPPPMVKSSMAHHARKLAAKNGMAGDAASSQGGGETAGSPSAAIVCRLDELEKTVDQLSNRAAAVNSGLDRLQQQQAARATVCAATWSSDRPA